MAEHLTEWRERSGRNGRGWVRVAVAGAFLLAASLHFTATETEMRLIPTWVPWHRELVYISGVAEILGALGLLVPRTRRLAAWGLALLLIAVFPANINHTVAHIQVGGFMDSRLYHWVRLPLQPLLIAVVLWCVAEKPCASITES